MKRLLIALLLAAASLGVTDAQDRLRIRAGTGAAEEEVQLTGLSWSSNGEGSTQFKFKDTDIPDIQPLTLIWKIRPHQQTGYYTTFFWAEDDFTFFNPDVVLKPYFGCHPYPDGGGSGTTHNWEISVQGFDDIDDENSFDTTVVQDVWKLQAATAVLSTGELEVNFYWDVAAGVNRRIFFRSTDSWGDNTNWLDPSLTFGDAPWSLDQEQMSSDFRGLIITQAVLSTTHIQALSALETDAQVLSYAASNSITLWYLNMNPTPSDISDKSGASHDPSWVGANRPTLYTE